MHSALDSKNLQQASQNQEVQKKKLLQVVKGGVWNSETDFEIFKMKKQLHLIRPF